MPESSIRKPKSMVKLRSRIVKGAKVFELTVSPSIVKYLGWDKGDEILMRPTDDRRLVGIRIED